MAEALDIVYLVKDTTVNEELRYSLRSVCENFTFRKVWFYGGRPNYLMPDEWVHVVQNQRTKWLRTTNMIRKICENPDITNQWWLFNDDFFVLQKTEGIEIPYDGSIYEHIVTIEDRHNQKVTTYTRELRWMAHELRKRGLPAINYAVHMPMLIDKNKALRTLDAFPNQPMFRSLYGNYNNLEGTDIKDCKIAGLERLPKEDAIFVSTDDKAFSFGEVGKYIRERFTEPCRYEI